MIELGEVDPTLLRELALGHDWTEPASLNISTTWVVNDDIKDIVKNIEDRFVRGKVVKRLFSRLIPGQYREPHIDYSEANRHRVHIPLTSNEDAVFFFEGEWSHCEVGKVYDLDGSKLHGCKNNGTTDRIHYIFDWIKE